ncbi:DUF2254 domain-containing protein [Aeromicrobium sp. CF3.5]|uniref:DUF2254 domain-containing protein n=1 Tax=Aeromicrobium sp. CF3.5 TaxID=3373078 RepID=UPI003EE7939B
MNLTWSRLWDAFRTNLWPIPTLGVLAALVLGLALPELDRRIGGAESDLIFGGGADAARTVLDAVASSMITVTSLTFSLTVVTLQLASSQFSPRLLRTFTRDLVVQGTLGLFLGTFTYALIVLRSVRTDTGGDSPFVPGISVSVAFVLALASVLALVFFLAHLTRTIRVESMLLGVHQDASQLASRRTDDDRITPADAHAMVPEGAVLVKASSSGFLVDVDEQDLVSVARDHGAVVFIERDPGDSVVAGTPIGWVWRADGGRWSDDECADLIAQVCARLTTGFERTGTSDVGLGLRQLTDVAVKALSPGINDPTTAVHALGHSSALLCELSQVPLGPRLLRDGDAAIRVVLSEPVLDDLLAVAVEQPAHYGCGDQVVMSRLFALLREVAWTDGSGTAGPVAGQLARLRRLVADADLDTMDRATLDLDADRVDEALAGRWDQTGRQH